MLELVFSVSLPSSPALYTSLSRPSLPPSLPPSPGSGDELLLTEMMFNGAFNDLTVEQCVALLSRFVFQEKVH